VGKDALSDSALIQLTERPPHSLYEAKFGDSSQMAPGDWVMAIGNPFGYTRTLTTGVVSAVQRQIEAPDSLPIDNAIQTDAAINHGNSGGPLIDVAGRVIGITSQISTGTTGQQGNLGIGFAIPINTVRNVAAQIIANGKALHAFLGLNANSVTPRIARLFHLPTQSGLLVQTVEKGSGADKAGLKAGTTKVVVDGESYQIGGDIIVAADGQPISTFDQLREAIAAKKPGQKMKLLVIRGDQRKTVTVTLGERPS